MHSSLRELAERYGIPLSNRSCHNDFVWDGKTMATHHQKENWDADGDNLLSLSAPIPIPDDWMAHEIAHWVVADPCEREFPEYGCMIGVVPFLATGNLPWAETTGNTSAYQLLCERANGILTNKEQNFREVCADLLATYWCDCFGIPVEEESRPINKIIASIGNSDSPYSIEEGWAAIIWLRERNLIP